MSDPGWPRPRKEYEGRQLPDLWILEDNDWLSFPVDRSTAAWHERRCAVCGEVMAGTCLLGVYQDPQRRETSGPGCHPRCMALALKFCPHFHKRELDDDSVVCFRHDGPGPGVHDDYGIDDEFYFYTGGTQSVVESATPVTLGSLKALAKSDPMGVLQ